MFAKNSHSFFINNIKEKYTSKTLSPTCKVGLVILERESEIHLLCLMTF